jgi:hypothetical protein
MGNYPLTKPARLLAGVSPAIMIPQAPTHTVSTASELLVLPAIGARRVRKIDAETPVTLVQVEQGWTLVARDGKPLGYIATSDLVPIQ